MCDIGVAVGWGSHALKAAADDILEGEGDLTVYEPQRQALDADELRHVYPVTIESVFAGGVAYQHLVDPARHAQSALLVVSALGHTRQPTRWLLGSVVERVAQMAAVPVIVVRDTRGLIEWASGNRLFEVLVGVDEGAAARAALDWVGELRPQAPCDIQIMPA